MTMAPSRLTPFENAIVVDRLVPHSVEAEEAVLGSMLIDAEALDAVSEVVDPADFYIVKHRWIFEAMQALRERAEPIDFVTVTHEIETRGQMDEAGGPAFVSHLINVVPTAIHAVGYAKIVQRAAVRRRLLDLASQAAQAGYDAEGEIDFEALQARLDALRHEAAPGAARMLTAHDILTTDWPEPVWVIPNYLPAGLTFLGGKQKVGKSWLMMQIACAKATGGRAFNLKIEQGPVLYLALEDSERRLRNRMRKQQWPTKAPVDFITMATFDRNIGNLANGGTFRIGRLVETRGYQLVVIDTFSKAVGMYMKASEQNDASIVTRAIASLQSIALQKDIAVVFLDHHSKATKTDGGDPVNDVIGSVAKGGVADTMWGLYRERGRLGAALQIVGRDIDGDLNLMLTFDKDLGIWQYEGDGSELRMTQRREEILEALGKLKRGMLQAICDLIGQPKSNTHSRLQELVSSGLVRKIEEGNNVFYEIQDE